jgi:hypothetical protein
MRDGHDDEPTTKLNLASSGSFVGETLCALGFALVALAIVAAAEILKSG